MRNIIPLLFILYATYFYYTEIIDEITFVKESQASSQRNWEELEKHLNNKLEESRANLHSAEMEKRDVQDKLQVHITFSAKSLYLSWFVVYQALFWKLILTLIVLVCFFCYWYILYVTQGKANKMARNKVTTKVIPI